MSLFMNIFKKEVKKEVVKVKKDIHLSEVPYKVSNKIEPISETVNRLIEEFSIKGRNLELMLRVCEEVAQKLSECNNRDDLRKVKVLDVSCGLCNMLDTYEDELSEKLGVESTWSMYRLTACCQRSWKYTTGICSYPLGGNHLWDGIYLDLRKDLLDHIIECLKQTLKHKETCHDL